MADPASRGDLVRWLHRLRGPGERDPEGIARDLAWLDGPNRALLTERDPLYPAQLAAVPGMPPALFVEGDAAALSRPQVAIVGSRAATAAGRETAFDFAARLGTAGLAITSGLAAGIDAQAHRGALAARGTTIAVCGTGLDLVYPAGHRELAARIAASGALVSEFLTGTPPRADNFPRRNRLMSGLARGVVVVGAASEQVEDIQVLSLDLAENHHLLIEVTAEVQPGQSQPELHAYSAFSGWEQNSYLESLRASKDLTVRSGLKSVEQRASELATESLFGERGQADVWSTLSEKVAATLGAPIKLPDDLVDELHACEYGQVQAEESDRLNLPFNRESVINSWAIFLEAALMFVTDEIKGWLIPLNWRQTKFKNEQAEKLGICIKSEFSSLALKAPCPVSLGERCTVFIESDLVHHQQLGADKGNLIAGLSYSIALNYLNKVVGDRRIGGHIFFQGGTAFNLGVVAAFEKILKKKITVPPNHDVTGAIGAAILARDENTTGRKAFKGFDLSRRNFELSSFECRKCPNRCEIKQLRVKGERPLLYGSRCERFEVNRRQEGILIVPALGITGGISIGVVNFGTVRGSSVPPGIAATACRTPNLL